MTNEEQTILIAYLVEAKFMAWHQVREGVVQGFGDLAQFCTGGNTGWGSCAFPGFLADLASNHFGSARCTIGWGRGCAGISDGAGRSLARRNLAGSSRGET